MYTRFQWEWFKNETPELQLVIKDKWSYCGAEETLADFRDLEAALGIRNRDCTTKQVLKENAAQAGENSGEKGGNRDQIMVGRSKQQGKRSSISAKWQTEHLVAAGGMTQMMFRKPGIRAHSQSNGL